MQELESLDLEDEALELDGDAVEREDSALEDLKAVQAALAAKDGAGDDEEDDLGSLGMGLGFGAQAAASLAAGASLGDGLGDGASPAASLAGAPTPAASRSSTPPLGVAPLAAQAAPVAAQAAPLAAHPPGPPEEKTRWGVVGLIAAVALATVGAVAYVAINPQRGSDGGAEEEPVGVGRAALAGGALAAGAANPTSQIQTAARPLGAAPEARPLAEAERVADEASKAALAGLDESEDAGLVLDDDADGEFEEGDPMHGGAKLERKKRAKVDVEYGIDRKKRDEGGTAEPEPEAAPEPEVAPTPAEDAAPAEPRQAKDEENIDCLLNPGAPGCKKYDKPKAAEEDKADLPNKLSQRDIAMGLSSPKKSAKQCGVTHGSKEMVRVHITIANDGSVSKVEAKGLHKGTPLGTCVEGFLSKATFPRFQHPSMGLDISVSM